MYEKNADIMSSLAGAKDTVSKGALSLLAKLKGTSQNNIDNSVRSQLPPDIASGISGINDKVQSQLPSDVSKIVDDVRSQPMGELANKATKLLGEGGRLVGDKVEKSNAPSALSYIPGIGGYLGGLAKPTPGRGRFVSSLGEGVSGSAGAGLGSALGLTGGATLGGIGHLLMSLLSKGKYHPSTAMMAAHPAMLGGGALGGLAGGSLGTHAGAGLFRDIAAKPEKNAELIGDQEEIDVNDNGKIEGVDLANLRKGKKPSKDKTKFADYVPGSGFSPNMPKLENKPNPFVQGKKSAPKANTAGIEEAQAKLASQDNASPSRSAAGDSKGVKYKQQNEDHATGTAAFDSLDKYLRMSKKAGLNDFQTNFFGRLIQEGRNEHEIYAAVKQANAQFGAEVGKELKRGFKKLAGVGSLLGQGLMTAGRAAMGNAGNIAKIGVGGGALAAGAGAGYGAAKMPGAVQEGITQAAPAMGASAANTAMDRMQNMPSQFGDMAGQALQRMPSQFGDMAGQALQRMPSQFGDMAGQALQRMPFSMGGGQSGIGQSTGGFAGPYKQSSEKWAARNSIFTDSGRFAGFGSATEDRLNRAGAYGPDLEAAVSKLKGKDFKGLLGKEVFKDIPYNMMQSRNPIGLEAMTTAQNMVDHKVLERAKGMTSLPKQVFNTMRDSPVTKKILATLTGLLTKRPLVAALGAGAAGGVASGAGVAGLMGLGKESSEKQAWAGLIAGAKAALPAVGRYMGIGGGMPGAIAKSTYNTAKGISGATTGDAIKAVLKNPQLQGQAITGASTGVMNPFTGLLATGDQDESWGHYLGRSALSGVAGAGAGFAGGRGTQDLMRRMGAGSQIGATGDLVGTIAGYDTGGMGAKGGFIGGGLMPAAVPKWMGAGATRLGGGTPGLPGMTGAMGGRAGNTADLLEKLDPLSHIGTLLGKGIGKGYNAIKGNAPGALNAAKGWAGANPIAASIAGVGGAGLAGGAYLGNRAVNAMEGARGDVNQQMNMFRAQTNNQMNGLREQIGGGMGGIGQFFNENKHWLMPALLAGGGALAGGAMGGGTGAALGGLSLPALYMMSQNGMFGGGGAANPLQAPEGKPRLDYAQQNQQLAREEADKQVAARTKDPRLDPKGIFAGSRGPNMSHLALK